MLKQFLDWATVLIESEEEKIANRVWLQAMVLTALATTILFAVINWRPGVKPEIAMLLGALAAFFLALLLMLRRGYLRRTATLFGLGGLAAMLVATYLFGGVQSGSYAGSAVALVIIAMFLRGRVIIIATAVTVLFGGILVWGEASGWYTADQSFHTPGRFWGSMSAIFVLLTTFVGVASLTVRKLFERNYVEIQERRKAERDLHEQTRYLAALHNTTLAIINRLELSPLLESILQSALELTETENGYIDMYFADKDAVLTTVGQGVFSQWVGVYKKLDLGISGYIFKTADALVLDDYAAWTGRIPEYADGFHAIVSVPLKVRGEVIGVIGLAYTEPGREFSPKQVAALRQVAELAALAVDNARLYQSAQDELRERVLIQENLHQTNQQLENTALALERRSNLLQVAAEVSRAASAILDPNELAQQVVDLAQQRFGLYYVGLFLVDEAGEMLHLRAGTGSAGHSMLQSGHKLRVGNTSMVGWCFANRQARIALDVGEDAVRFSNPLLPGTRSELALPLISRGQTLGAMTIQSENEAAFSDENLETFQTLADQLANAILNARLYDQLGKELEERKRAESKIRRLNRELEQRVERRTLALKASEEKFRALSENNPLRIRRYDRDGRYLYANWVSSIPNFNPNSVIGKTIREVVDDPELVELGERCIRQVFDTGKPLHTEYKFGDSSYASWWLAPEFDPEGNVVSVVTTTLDITERRQMEDELRARTLELQASNRELESFSYSVSHDLRAPLRALDGFSRILLDDFHDSLPQDGQHYLTRIRESVQQMSRLIDDMLRLSRITRVEMRHYPVDLAGIATEIIDSFKNQEPERIVDVEIHQRLVVNGDEGLLRMALENLLNNAWKFSAKTSQARIEVGKTKFQNEETFFVRDNGVGFDMAYADKLFSVFQRLHSPREFPGTGVGLAIVQRVIHRHGGKIWAESAPGQGTTFYFTVGSSFSLPGE